MPLLDISVAQEISNLATSLGLPLSKENDLILALTSVDLLDSSEQEAEIIWRDAQLPDEAQSFLQDEDAIAWIATEILPAVKSYVNGKLQHAAIPYGYPIMEELIESVYPHIPDSSIQIMIASWETQRWNAIKYLALCEIWKLVDSTKPEYAAKGEGFCKNGSLYLNELLSTIEGFLKRVPNNPNRGTYGTLVIKLHKNRYRL